VYHSTLGLSVIKKRERYLRNRKYDNSDDEVDDLVSRSASVSPSSSLLGSYLRLIVVEWYNGLIVE